VWAAFKKTIETSLRSLYVISASLIALAVVLFIVERLARTNARWRR
jgi:undecaprenyl-diphosphatase